MSSWAEISGVRLPVALVGTSPFIGAGQFGPRALALHARFFGKPGAVAEVLEAAIKAGAGGVQALSYPFIVEAIRAVEARMGLELPVVATVGPEDPFSDLRLFDGLDVRAYLLHGALTDSSWPGVERLLEEARATGALAGYVSHKPMRMLERIRSGELPRPDLVMIPLNKAGYLMDAPAEELNRALRELGLRAIAKKILAAGRLRPREALEFVLQHDAVVALAVGVSSAREARETFTILTEVLARR